MKRRVIKVIFCAIIVLLIALLLITAVNHQIQLKKETELLSPLGQMVEVDGHDMSVYIE